MALPAKNERYLHETDVLEVAPPSPTLAPILPKGESGSNHVTNHKEPAMEDVRIATAKIGALCGEAAGRVELTFYDLFDRAHRFSRGLQRRAERIRHENPFEAVAIIGTAAFVAGLILRISRSTRNG